MAEQREGERMVEGARQFKYLERQPWRAAEFDPPLSEYLKLPIAESCPVSTEHPYWGTDNPTGYLQVCRCKACGAKFRPFPSAYQIRGLIDALVGTPQKLARG